MTRLPSTPCRSGSQASLSRRTTANSRSLVSFSTGAPTPTRRCRSTATHASAGALARHSSIHRPSRRPPSVVASTPWRSTSSVAAPYICACVLITVGVGVLLRNEVVCASIEDPGSPLRVGPYLRTAVCCVHALFPELTAFPYPPHHSLATFFLAAQDGRTASILASDGGHLEVVRLLLDKGAKVDAATQVRQPRTRADRPPLRHRDEPARRHAKPPCHTEICTCT